MTFAHEERVSEERAGVDVDRHFLDDATVLDADGREVFVVPADDDGYEVHRWLMARRRGDHRYERGHR